MQIPKEVLSEIENIKIYATNQEINRLDISELDGAVRTNCIYGQMTGECRSERARELIKLCVSSLTTLGDSEIDIKDWDDELTRAHFSMCSLLTPLEKFIYSDTEVGIKIVLYIQNLITEL